MYINKMPSDKILSLTKDGIDSLKQRLDELVQERRSVYKLLKKADNQNALRDLIFIDRIKMLEMAEREMAKIVNILKHATALHKRKDPEVVELGTTITLSGPGGTSDYTIVCPLEVDLDSHKISDESPLGKALYGRGPNEDVNVTNAKGKMFSYRILAIK